MVRKYKFKKEGPSRRLSCSKVPLALFADTNNRILFRSGFLAMSSSL